MDDTSVGVEAGAYQGGFDSDDEEVDDGGFGTYSGSSNAADAKQKKKSKKGNKRKGKKEIGAMSDQLEERSFPETYCDRERGEIECPYYHQGEKGRETRNHEEKCRIRYKN